MLHLWDTYHNPKPRTMKNSKHNYRKSKAETPSMKIPKSSIKSKTMKMANEQLHLFAPVGEPDVCPPPKCYERERLAHWGLPQYIHHIETCPKCLEHEKKH